jgi:hypothetical protein
MIKGYAEALKFDKYHSADRIITEWCFGQVNRFRIIQHMCRLPIGKVLAKAASYLLCSS